MSARRHTDAYPKRIGHVGFDGLNAVYRSRNKITLRLHNAGAARAEEATDMPGYNSKFELSVEDMDLIEAALRQTKSELSARVLPEVEQHDKTEDSIGEADETLRQIHDLLGRLHNQKVFYRPRRGAYIGG